MVALKPFYLKTWFLLLSGLVFLLSGPLFYNLRTNQLRRQKAHLEEEVARRTQTIRHQAEELKSLEKLKSRFFTNVSHELRTPLTLILGPIQSILKRKEEGQEKMLLSFVQRNAQQLQKLINEILDLSKLEDHKLEVVEEPVHFYPYLKDQLAQFHSAARSDQLDFEFLFKADKSTHILLDKPKFEKILHNYLSNAMKFTPPRGKVKLTVEDFGNHLRLNVSDTGHGIPADDLPHIFDRFYQSKQTEGGTGIGLSLVKELAELLSGKVWANSEFGNGSTFYFEFPKKTVDGRRWTTDGVAEAQKPKVKSEYSGTLSKIKQSSTPDPYIGDRGPSAADRQPSTILLVEDNSDLREYIKVLLPEYKILAAENGKVGLEVLSRQSTVDNQSKENQTDDRGLTTVDLIISDLMMPVMDGFEFLERVKSADRWRHIPVIMLTAKVNVKAKLQALRIGVDDYLTKPFQEEELKARIENLLHNYRERMELFAAAEEESGEELISKKPVMAQTDAEWLQKVERVFEKSIGDYQLKMDWVAGQMYLSQRQFGRRLQQLTGLKPHQYLLEIRLKLARDFLLEGKYSTVKEVGFAVGFRDSKYFSRRFRERFGIAPSEVG